GSANIGGREVLYSAIVYGQRGNGIAFTANPRDNVSITESHEISEAVTDPDVMAAQRRGDPNSLGWYDDHRGEIGYIPIREAALHGDRTLHSAWGRSNGYAFQKEWSEHDRQ